MATLSQSAWQYPFATYQRLYLENTTKGHRKFYEMVNFGSSWTARWGKIGQTGQTMTYNSGLWGDKLSEKLKKGYVLTEAISIGAANKRMGIVPPIVRPRKPDPAILVDPEMMAKLDRIELFLNEKKNTGGWALVSDIKAEYVRTGVLTKNDMEKLNKLWVTNGGGRW